jgi:type IV pilus assembly protein PilY1
MLVGGLNAGGKGYYAIDITDPATPKAMWEFKFGPCYDGTAATAGADCHLGLTFGKPIITKVVDSSYPEGRWVVIVSSGYNNVRGGGLSGDGSGYLYVLDAITGTIVYKIDTGAGSATTPSNLGQLNAYVDDGSVNNTAVRVYGGDMLGNVWRFDVNDTHAPSGREATLLGQARDSSNNPQPITTRPELAELNGKPMVFVATGRMLGATDITDTQRQSMYGIVDPLTGSPVYSDLRGALKPMVISETGTGVGATRTVACDPAASAAACASTNGWVSDLPDTGERVNVDMKLALGTLVIASNVPPTSACDTGGYSWFNYVDFASGNAVLSSPGGVTGVRGDYGQTVGFSILRFQADGTFSGFVRGAGDGSVDPRSPTCPNCGKPPVPVDPPKPKGKRISWREIAQ